MHPKKAERYAMEWSDLIALMEKDDTKPLEVPCASDKDARVMRLEFYKYREALFRDSEGMSDNLRFLLDSREVKVRDNFCIFDTKSNGKIGRTITAFLEARNAKQE